jgi:hypothetical protein
MLDLEVADKLAQLIEGLTAHRSYGNIAIVILG